MKYLLLILTFTFPSGLFGQMPIPDGDFEGWNNAGLFEEPSSGFWATLNPLRLLGGPITVTKSADAHGGNYSARMESKVFGTLLVPGLLISGDFDNNALPNFIVPGKPYTDKPLNLTGWVKYFPVNGDSGGIAIRLFQRNGDNRDLIGMADTVFYDSIPNWTLLTLPFRYFIPGATPDSIEIVIVSSLDGANFNGQEGSTIMADDFSLSGIFLDSERFTENENIDIWPQPAAEILFFSGSGKSDFINYSLRSLTSVCVLAGDISESMSFLDISHIPAGMYILSMETNQNKTFKKKIIVSR